MHLFKRRSGDVSVSGESWASPKIQSYPVIRYAIVGRGMGM